MKKIKIFTFTVLLSVISFYANAQIGTWGTSTVAATTAGDCNVDGGLGVHGGIIDMSIPSDPASAMRGIMGNTAKGGISILANTGGADGPAISLHGKSLPLLGSGENRAGSIYYTSYFDDGPLLTDRSSHRFLVYDHPTTSFLTAMVIGNDGRTIVGRGVDYSFIATGDNLTVRDQLGLFPSETSAANVRINGNTSQGSLTLNANTTEANGGSISLRGVSIDGGIRYTASNAQESIGHLFLNHTGGISHNNTIITNDGRMVVGHDMQLAWAAAGDVLTVRDQIGLFPSWTSAEVTRINGNTVNGAFLLHSNTNQSDGPSIGMYGGPGGKLIRYVSTNTGATIGHQFQNYDGSVFHNNTIIGNDGRMLVGNDMQLSYAAAGDVLTVRDQIGLFPSWTSGAVTKINGNTSSGAFLLNGNTNETNGPSIGMYGAPGGGVIKYIAHDYGSGAGVAHEFISYYGSAHHTNMIVYGDGKVAIGQHLATYPPAGPDPLHPNGYLLYVEKGILTEHVKVAINGTSYWSDFVFNKNYDLMPLNEVEDYIKENKHLPEIPSAEEVVKEGVDLGSMDAKLLQKIEELTLYVIQQQKEINELKKKMDKKK